MSSEIKRALTFPSLSFGGQVTLLVLAFLLLMLPVGGPGSLERAEVYFMAGARSMLEGADWLIPYYRSEPFFDKPALTYWLIAGSYRLFGVTPEAARVVPALSGAACLVVTVWLGALLLDRRSAILGGVVLATTLPYLSFGRIAMSDMTLTLCTTTAVALAVRCLQPRPPWILYPLLGAALGLGFLTKGPIALIFPFLAVLPFLWGMRRQASRPPVPAIVGAALCFAVTGFGWFVAVYVRKGWEPLDYFFFRENVERFSSSTFDLGRGADYYLLTYLAQGFPWSLFLPWSWLRSLKERDESARNARRLLAAFALMLALLSFSRGKLDYYLLPLYPLSALAVGRYFAAAQWRRSERVFAGAIAALAGASLLAASVVWTLMPPNWRPPASGQLVYALLAGIAVVVFGPAILDPRPRRIATFLAVAAAMIFGALAYLWQPAFGAGQPNRAILSDVWREHAACPAARLALCEDPTHVQRDIIFITRVSTLENCDLATLAGSSEPFLLLLRERELRSIEGGASLRRIGDYSFLPARVFSLNGLRKPPLPERLHLVANDAFQAARVAP